MKFENLTPHTFNPKLESITQNEFLSIITPHIELHSEHIYETAYASIGLPYDDSFIQESTNLAKKFQNTQAMLLIGIGGSNLGTLAIHEALGSNLENKKQLFSLDTPDVRDYKKIHREIMQLLEKGEHICITIISKSGTTTETIALFETVYNDLYTTYPLQCSIVAITDEGSKLYNLAQNEGWDILTLPKNVGGRYSVFSNVGLFPLAFLEYNIEQLLNGARGILESFIQEPLTSPAYTNASILYTGYTEENRNICEHFFFGKSYENIGKWYRQLLAESIGKRSEGNESIGITPTTSIGTIDLHSVGQLDLAHGKDRTLVLVFPENGTPLYTPKEVAFPSLVENIRGVSFERIQYAAFEGTRRALLEKHIPTMTYTLEDDSIEDIGAFLQSKMIEVILLGHFFSINPFDQPNVEDYKTGMREVLSRGIH